MSAHLPPTPFLAIDLAVLDANIERVAAWADKREVLLRPHVKTHKSPEVAHRQLGQLEVRVVTHQALGQGQGLAGAALRGELRDLQQTPLGIAVTQGGSGLRWVLAFDLFFGGGLALRLACLLAFFRQRGRGRGQQHGHGNRGQNLAKRKEGQGHACGAK